MYVYGFHLCYIRIEIMHAPSINKMQNNPLSITIHIPPLESVQKNCKYYDVALCVVFIEVVNMKQLINR